MGEKPPLPHLRTIELRKNFPDSPDARRPLHAYVPPDGEFDEKVGEGLRVIMNIVYQRLRQTAYAADTSRGKRKAHKLMQLLDEERKTLSRMKRENIPFEQREGYIRSSKNQQEIHKLYLELGMARMLTLGDWSVNRGHTVAEGLGVVPFPQIETLLLHFYKRNKNLATDAPVKEGKLVHFHSGCGNGVLLEQLRREKTEPFRNGRRLMAYWTEIGIADRIYFTLNDLLASFLREEYRDDPTVKEFIEVISTLLLRRLYYLKKNRKFEKFGEAHLAEYEQERLEQLLTNVNEIGEILRTLPRYVKNLTRLPPSIKADGEFIRDTPIGISAACRKLIREYYDPKGREAPPGTPGRSRDQVLFDMLFGELSREERASRKTPQFGGNAFVKKFFTDDFLNTDLNQHISIWPHHVIPGRFEELDTILPAQPLFDLIHNFRASSHLPNAPYGAYMRALCTRLKPGGMLLDDGYRESYTREERIGIWKELARELQQEYRIEIIKDEKGPKSIFVQRSIKQDDGAYAFLNEEERELMLGTGCSYLPLDDFEDEYPERMIRSAVAEEIKKLLIDTWFEPGDDEKTKEKKTTRGRVRFEDLHANIDLILNKDFFTSPMWKNYLDRRRTTAERREGQVVRKAAFQLVAFEIEDLRKRLLAVTAGARPHRPDDFSTEVFPLIRAREEKVINAPRRLPTKDLPRNLNIPSLEELEEEQKQLIHTLDQIRAYSGRPPLRVAEFDSCFTNPLMRDFIFQLMGNRRAGEELVEIEKIKLHEHKYPAIQEGSIYLLSGSLNNTYDPFGAACTEEFSVPLMEGIQKGDALRASGICFGHQTLLEAYGRLHNLPTVTEQGALEFGTFPVRFPNPHSFMKHLAGKTCSVGFTRSGYTTIPDYKGVPDMIPLAFECDRMVRPGKGHIAPDLPPVGFALEGGKVATFQFHPDILLSEDAHRRVLRRYLARYHVRLRELFSDPYFFNSYSPPDRSHKKALPRAIHSPYTLYNHNIGLNAQNKIGGTVPWVAQDIGPALLLPTLNHLASSLLAQLQRAS